MAKILLEMKQITKTFPGVKALDNVNLKVEEGEIHALVGENGAGKSTLMNVLSGIYPYGTYEGDIIYDGEVCKFSKIKDSEEKGIVIIHQELALVPEMTIGENMYLGNERGSKYAIDWDKTYGEAEKYLKQVGLKESSHVLIKDIGVGKQQLVEIAKALAKKAKLLILDEPTASLNEEDSKALLDLMLAFKKQGMTMIIITHKLNEVSYVADKITIIRDGSTIETLDKKTDNITEERIIKGMVGRELTSRFPKREPHIGDVELEVKDWTVYHNVYAERKVVDNVSIHVCKGEVVGISGLMGAGRTELAMSIFGKSYGKNISGKLFIEGKEVKNDVTNNKQVKVKSILESAGCKIEDEFSEYVEYDTYKTQKLTLRDVVGNSYNEIAKTYKGITLNSQEDIMKISDYNKVAKLYGQKTFKLKENQYLVVANFQGMVQLRNIALKNGEKIKLGGKEYSPLYRECKYGFVNLSGNEENSGIIVLPDSALKNAEVYDSTLVGKYNTAPKDEIIKNNDRITKIMGKKTYNMISINTKMDVAEACIGIGAIVTFIGMYL